MKVNFDSFNQVPKTSGVPPIMPQIGCDIKVVVLGEQPRTKEAIVPFEASWESALRHDLRECGIELSQVMQANVLSFYPSKGHLKVIRTKAYFDYDDIMVRSSINEVEELIREFNPDLVIGFGTEALRFLKDSPEKLDSERGAPFRSKQGWLSLVTYHPSRVFIQYKLHPLVLHDIKKALRLAREKWDYPKYDIKFLPTFQECCGMLNLFLARKPYLAVDIETTGDLLMTCVGIAYNKKSAIVIPFFGERGKPYFDKDEHKIILQLLSRVLNVCPLVGHNAVHFDHFALAVKYRILANFIDDTMFAHWEKFCELEKSLGFISSLYTDNPYWKGVLKDARNGRVPYWKEYEYCGKDCIVTLQCAYAIATDLKSSPTQVSHYKFNIKTSRAFQYMSVQGFVLDRDKHAERLNKLEVQAVLLGELFEEQSGKKISDILKTTNELNAKEKRLFRITSPLKMKNWLYKDLALPPQTKLKKNEFGEYESSDTADYLALLYLARQFPEEPAIETAGKLRRLLKRISTLRAYRYEDDGRMRWTFNLVGTKTGRASGYKPLDGVGIQPQNVDRNDRDLCLALPFHWWWKADLEGADSWTVAAQLASLGHTRMMEDLRHGLKPAARLAIAELAGDVVLLTAPAQKVLEQKHLMKSAEGKIVYKVNKAVSHGTNYGMKKKTMHQNIFKQSDGDLYVPLDECDAKQKILLEVYGLSDLHNYMEGIMIRDAVIETGLGTKRQFFGRRDNSMLREMLSHLPQYYTGLTSNVVIARLYYGSANRVNGHLVHRPAVQVHDEACTFIPKGMEDRAIQIFREVMNVPVKLWGQYYTIPWEAGYGPSWGEINEVEL